jgi:hypothetical protein
MISRFFSVFLSAEGEKREVRGFHWGRRGDARGARWPSEKVAHAWCIEHTGKAKSETAHPSQLALLLSDTDFRAIWMFCNTMRSSIASESVSIHTSDLWGQTFLLLLWRTVQCIAWWPPGVNPTPGASLLCARSITPVFTLKVTLGNPKCSLQGKITPVWETLHYINASTEEAGWTKVASIGIALLEREEINSGLPAQENPW